MCALQATHWASSCVLECTSNRVEDQSTDAEGLRQRVGKEDRAYITTGSQGFKPQREKFPEKKKSGELLNLNYCRLASTVVKYPIHVR